MRFPFGFKGTLDTSGPHSESSGSAKASKSSKDNGEIICTGYRTFSDFDGPRRSPPPSRLQNNQASTSKATTNGVIPKDKIRGDSATKNKIQQKQAEKAKTTKVVDTTKEQKQQKDTAKAAQKTEGKVKAQKLKEQKDLDKKREQQLKEQKQKESKVKEKEKKQKEKAPAATKSEKNSSSILGATSKSSSKLKAKKGKAPGSPPAGGGIDTVNPMILAKEQEKANRKKNKSKTTAPSPNNTKTTVEDGKNKTKSLPNLTSPELDHYENNQPDDGSISVVSGKTVKATPSDDDNKKSTLIFMTEDHENNETSDYETLNDYQKGNPTSKVKETKNEQQKGSRMQNNYSNEYSSHAASIFFNSGSEPIQQPTRAYRYRDDDDNASQTSA